MSAEQVGNEAEVDGAARRPPSRRTRLWRAMVSFGLAALAGSAAVAGAAAFFRTGMLLWDFVHGGAGAGGGAGHPWLDRVDRVLRWDISTASTAVIALLFLLLWAYFWGTGRDWLRAQKARPAARAVFPEWFAGKCIQLGLLGTLLSLALIAATWSSAGKGGTTRPTAAAAIGGPTGVPLTDESMQIFRLLCAKLFATLVGCAVAYVAVPLIEWVAPWFTGVGRRRAGEEALEERAYLGELERATGALASLSREVVPAGVALALLKDNVEGLRVAGQESRAAASEFAALRTAMSEGLAEMKSAAASVTSAARAMEKAAGGLKGVAADVRAATAAHRQQVDAVKAWLDTLSAPVNGAVDRLREALESLRAATDAARSETVGPLGALVKSLGEMLRSVRAGLGEVAAAAQVDRDAAAAMVESMRACGAAVRAAAESVSRQAEEMRREVAAAPDSSTAKLATTLRETRDMLATLVGIMESEINTLVGATDVLRGAPPRPPIDTRGLDEMKEALVRQGLAAAPPPGERWWSRVLHWGWGRRNGREGAPPKERDLK